MARVDAPSNQQIYFWGVVVLSNSARASPLFHHFRFDLESGEKVENLQNGENTTFSPSSGSGEKVVDSPLKSGDQ